MMQRLASVGGIEGVESVEAASAYEIELEEFLIAGRRDFIYAYCVVVVVANWTRAAPLLVASAARLSK